MEEMHSLNTLKLGSSGPIESNTGKTWSWNAGILNGIAPCPVSEFERSGHCILVFKLTDSSTSSEETTE